MTLDAESTEALMQRRERVLEALDEAKAESVGNERLVNQFGDIKRALALVDTSAVDAPSDQVEQWRVSAARRYPTIVAAADEGRKPIGVRAGSGEHDQLAEIMTELDRRANARGAAPA